MQIMLILLLSVCRLALARQRFPLWLEYLTGLDDWPGDSPPYVPMPQLELDTVPEGPIYGMDDCLSVPIEACSFYCDNCAASSDVTTCPRLSQTFDDGPTMATDYLLDNLKQPTTFFTLGRQVVKYPGIFKRARDDGHLLGTHTWSHVYLPSLTNEEIAAQLQWSMFAMNVTGGVVPRFFRPPYGGIDNRVREIASRFGLITVLWDSDPQDWRLNNGSTSKKRVFNMAVPPKGTKRPQGLILEHDTTMDTVRIGLDISRQLKRQFTVADCIDTGRWYLSEP
ncbi:Chitin deacetylase 2 [Wickerhamiella sorbophila]|uniref:chitin deacetylase n=1 Tax=Wickerhamiella sorbophila TaxID=45607 RepID=A0A2T0FKG8_9ASCO|nr:Chitin deacetylase 2 [Wickerhamiella sorbophila]PRT55469.1 Chitin deacetylase 2 [Wickerhamiella sorbophila]